MLKLCTIFLISFENENHRDSRNTTPHKNMDPRFGKIETFPKEYG